MASVQPAGLEALMLRGEVEDLLFREAALLDAREFEAWLELYAEDAIYWIPGSDADDDPTRRVSIVYDNHSRLRERVWRLGSGLAYGQEPESRTIHLVGNVRVLTTEDDLVTVGSNAAVVEFRRARKQVYAARCTHHLRREDGSLKIVLKRIEMVDNVGHLGNLSIIM